MRHEFSKSVKLARWEHAKGFCESCGVKIRAGNGPHYDHSTPDAVGGQPSFENCQVLCRSCHGVKTNTVDVPEIARTKRIKAKHLNATDKRGGFRGHRRFDGSIVWK